MSCDRCNHDILMLTRRVISGGSVQYVYQCQVCGKPKQPIAKHKAMEIASDSEIAEFNPDLEREYYSAKERKAQTEAEQRRSEFFAWYDEYLKSPEWRQKRELVFRRAGGVCEGCGIAPATEVHHQTYDHVGEEFLWELVAICNPCHTRFHAPEPDDEIGSDDFIDLDGGDA